MTITRQDELDGLKRIGRIVANTMHAMAAAMEPGMTTRELDGIGQDLLEREGAISAPKVTYDFPGATCISVNEEIAHGIPGDRRMAAGDLVNIDVSASLDGYFADTGASFCLGPVPPALDRLCRDGKRAMHDGLVLTVEPFLSRGGRWAVTGADDDWTLRSRPAAPVVQYEHTVVATRRGAIILTLPG